jgi:hypothetical protein
VDRPVIHATRTVLKLGRDCSQLRFRPRLEHFDQCRPRALAVEAVVDCARMQVLAPLAQVLKSNDV